MTRLRIAMQKSGRLAERSLELIASSGLRVQKGANDLIYRIENQPIDLLRVRDDDIPVFVDDSVCELGIIGENVLVEHDLGRTGPRAEIILRLGFGKCTLKIAAPQGFEYHSVKSLEGLRIATSYPNLTSKYLADAGVSAEIVELRGAVEVAPRLGVAHAICDLVSTGATLEANGLRAVETVFTSEAVLIRAPTIKPELEALATQITRRFESVTASQGAKYILMNAPRAKLAAISALLPGVDAPTVTPLAGREDAVAVHAVCQESVFWETLDQLKAEGASAILVLPIEKMMM